MPAAAVPSFRSLPSRAEGRANTGLTLALIAVWTLVFCWPSLRLEGFDDAFFSEVAHLWTEGRAPYLHAFDIKPPAYFLWLALAQTAFGPTIETLRGLSFACDVVAAGAICLIGRNLGAPRAGLFAALTYGVLAPYLIANDAYPPLVAVTTLAFLAAFAPAPLTRRALTTGLLVGVMVMTKQTAALEAVAALAALLRSPDARGRSWPTLGLFAAAAAVAPLGFFAYFAAQGGARVFLDDVVVFALQRPGGVESVSLASDIARFVVRLSQIGPAVPVAAFAAWRARRLFRDAAAADALVLWAGLALVGLWAQHSRGLAYIGPVIPPTLLLAFAGVERGLGLRAGPARNALMAALAFACVAGAYPYRAEKVRRPIDAAASAEAAAIVRAAGPQAGDRLLAIDFGGWVNILTDLPPPTPYLHRLHLLCAFPGAGPDTLAATLAARPRFVVVGAYRGKPSECEGPSGWEEANRALASGYSEIGHVTGETDDLRVFAAKPASSP